MKKTRIIISILLVCLIAFFTGCQSKMVESTQHATGRTFTNKYMSSLKGITSTDYEGYWIPKRFSGLKCPEKIRATGEWYCSNQFTAEFNTMLQIKDLRFNGKDAIVFDAHTF